jgi:RNA polymerase sigma factor (sigma-70 family)
MGTAADFRWVEDLVKRARDGDDEAFRELLQSHRAAVTSTLVACGVRTADTAEDLAQEVALRAWSRLPTLVNPGSFTAWIRRIAANAARDSLRRLAARREQDLEDALNLADPDDPVNGRVGAAGLLKRRGRNGRPHQQRRCGCFRSRGRPARLDVGTVNRTNQQVTVGVLVVILPPVNLYA